MNEYCPIVETTLGKVKGRVVNNVDKGRDVYRYSSIPFAKPPVGDLRFKAPEEPESWDGVLNGADHSPAPQQDPEHSKSLAKYIPSPDSYSLSDVSEDCLYLSVYTTTVSETAKLPVLIWFFGGGFTVGGERCYDGSVLAAMNDVVVVIPNYRLSVFGFLAMGRDSEIPGNAGLLDQLMAMKWVRKHIQNFGGDPRNVTIIGQSAGGGAVNYHVVSEMSQGWFDKAVSQSGSMHVGDFLKETDGNALKMLLEELKIEEKDEKEIIKRLQIVPAEDLMKALGPLSMKMAYFAPCVDGKFFKKPLKELAEGKVNPVPYIVGCVNTEANGILTIEQPPNFKTGITKEACIENLQGMIEHLLAVKGLPKSAYLTILKEYGKNIPDDDKLKWSRVYGAALADPWFILPAVQTAKQHVANKCSTYMYMMTQQTKLYHDSEYGPESIRRVDFCECDHGDDLIYTLGFPFYNKKFTMDVKFSDDEAELSREWMKYLVNFATTGDPNKGQPVKVKWPQYGALDQAYLSVQQPCTVGEKLVEDRYNFWKDVITPMRKTS